MTRINNLVMKGFKSFAKYTELEFSEKFNCVIGPNGSGKSNVLDALCFVLGKSSTKSLRAEKSANLIYNGGKARKPAKEAEVSIWFDNSKNEFPTEDEEVKLTRIVRQSGNSVYKINDKTRTRQEIIDLLSIAKIDPNGYNIILQGDIVRFVNMSANERRELIEEISGIGVYEERKKKAINDLDKVERKIEEAGIILNEKQSYLKELEKERKQAIKYNSIKEKLKINRATHTKRELQSKKELIQEFEEKYKELEQKLTETNEKTAAKKKEVQEKRAELNAINKEIEDKSEKEQVSLNRDIEDLKIELATAKTRVENNKNELAKLEMRKDQLQLAKKEVEEKVEAAKEKKKELQSYLDATTKEHVDIEQKIKTFREKNNLDSAADYEKRIADLDHETDELQNQINNLRQTQQELTRRKDFLEMKTDSFDEQINRFSEIESEHKEQIAQLKQYKNEFKQTTVSLNDALSRDTKYAAELGQKKSELSVCNQEIEKLQSKLNAAMDVLLRDGALKEINSYRKQQDGIYGTISELADVDEEYSLAIEIAAGNKLKGIVVEDENVAVDCIKHLRNSKSGVATFFPRTKIKPRKEDTNVTDLTKKEGVVGLATNLLHYDPKFENVFSFIFGNTLVVRSIEDAKRLGINSAKMVTLSGDLLEKSGSLQGGFRKKTATGTFSHKQLKEQLDEKEAVRATLQQEIEDLIAAREKNEQSIDSLRTRKAELEGEIIKLEKSLHLDATDTDTLKKQKLDTKKQLESIETELDEFNDKITNINRELAQKKTEKQQLRDKINEVRNPKIVAQLNAYEETRKDLSKKQMQYDLDLKNIDIQLDTMHKPELAKNKEQLQTLQTEKKEITDEIATLTENIKKTSESLKKREAQQSEFQKKYKGLFTKRQQLTDKIDGLDNQIDKLNEQLRKTEINMNSITLQRDQYKNEVQALESLAAQYEGVEVDTEKSDAQIKREITQHEKYLEDFNDVNLKAIEMYETIKNEYDELVKKIESLKQEKDDVHLMIQEIENRKKELFMETFNIITAHFKKFFSTLSKKGDAYLILENEEDPFAAGVLIKVRLKGQKYIDIRSLSGGEKTMTALAFIFAIQEFEPASFIIMDEVDAALDKKNSEMLSRLINSYTDRAQFIVISHNEVVITEANVLYGVSMNEHGASKITTLSLEEGKEQLREQENQGTEAVN